MNAKTTETKIRSLLRARLSFRCVRVNSVAFIDQAEAGEFAVIQISQESPDAYEWVLEFITDPQFPFRITRERSGQRDEFIYLAHR